MTTHKEQIKEACKGNAILFGANRELRRLPLYLHEEEIVHDIITGSPGKNKGRGIIVATNERILFIKDGWVLRTIQDFPYETISSVEFKTAIFFGSFIMYGKGDETEYNWVGRFAGASFAKTVRKLSAEANRPRNAMMNQNNGLNPLPPLPAVPLSKEDAIFKQLEDLGKLRDKGIINIDEFEIKKQELLGRL